MTPALRLHKTGVGKLRRIGRKRGFTPESLAAARFLVTNFLLSRTMPFGESGSNGIDQDNLDLSTECRWPTNPNVYLYRNLYEREGIAQRINDVYPDECWSIYPEAYQTETARTTSFESAWNRLQDEQSPWHYLHSIDRLSGLGRYGCLLFGLTDGQDLERPIPGLKRDGTVRAGARESELIYLQPYSEDLITINKFETDKTNPRYGQPVMYTLKAADPRMMGGNAGVVYDSNALTDIKVHWSRVLHVADNRMSMKWAGQPRMEPVVNRIYDLRKILGSSAEMFFKGGFPGYTFAAFDNPSITTEIDEDSIKEQLDDYMNGLKRYLASTGGEFKALLTQVADPTNHVVQQIMYICATIGVPYRILMGSEAGSLASTQDAGTWNRRLARRQMVYLNPMVIRPFINRLMMIGALPRVKSFKIDWRDLNSMTDVDKSKVALSKAQAMMQYVSGKVETMMPLKQFFTMVMGMTPDEADAVIAARASTVKFMTEKGWQTALAKPQGGGRTGNAPSRASGRPARTTSRS